MSDYSVTILLDSDKEAKVAAAELGASVVTVDGKKAISVPVTAKEQKKLVKGFAGLTFDAANACTLPADAEEKLFGFVCEMKNVDVMKFAIMKIYNPLAGKAPRSAQR
ncbi:MAG: hypothetical protein JEZ11_17355 [Desulfobacterales bacterium]|nr:hypothetical protein [Desulfobacterales bacterium]